jgi:hypothetical protein
LLRCFEVGLSIAGRILRFAPSVLDLALYLLNSAFNLGSGIAGQVSDMPLGASNHIVDGAFHSILVHFPRSRPPVVHEFRRSAVSKGTHEAAKAGQRFKMAPISKSLFAGESDGSTHASGAIGEQARDSPIHFS